jgi:hypothetical protein
MNDPLARLSLTQDTPATPLHDVDRVRGENDIPPETSSFSLGTGAVTGDDDYWDEARRPFVCLAFLAPLLAFYELGAVLCAPQATGFARNGADSWLRGGLALIGLEASWLLPALVLGGLLGWQALGRHRWTVRPLTLAGMSAESLLLAFVLIVMGHLQDLAFQHCSALPVSALPVSALPTSPLPGTPRSVNALPDYVPDDAGPDESPRSKTGLRQAVPASRPSPTGPRSSVGQWRSSESTVSESRPLRVTGSHPVRPRSRAVRVQQTPEARFVSLPETGRSGRSSDWSDPRETSFESSSGQRSAPSPQRPSTTAPADSSRDSLPTSAWRQQFARCVLFVGAGVYEEFLFRLLLLPSLILLFTKGGVPAARAGLLAILWTSVLFSAAHYIGPGGDRFSLFTFLFRFLAGLFFATVFLHRGFGIVVGCHAAYDLLVGLMLPLEPFTG